MMHSPAQGPSAVWGGATLGLIVGAIVGLVIGSFWAGLLYGVLIGAGVALIASILGWIADTIQRRSKRPTTRPWLTLTGAPGRAIFRRPNPAKGEKP